MKIQLDHENNEIALEAQTFQEARALAILYQRIACLRSASEDVVAWADDIFLDDTGKTLALVWRPSKSEGAQ